VHEAEVIIFEGPVRLAGAAWPQQAAETFSFQNAIDRVSVEMRHEVADLEGEVIERKAG
jgi:hypothetical protein